MNEPVPNARLSLVQEELLNELLSDCIGALDHEGVTVETALGRVADSHPELVGELRASLEALRQIGLLDVSATSGDMPERMGEYRILRRLGGGGMGVVFLAEQPSLQRRVALKVLRPEERMRSGGRERFQREVEAAARLAHPGVVQVYSIGDEGGVPYIAMEHVPGCSLDRVLLAVGDRPPTGWSGAELRAAIGGVLVVEGDDVELDWDDSTWTGSWQDVVLRMTLRVAEALQHAHERGVLHRDLKPSNILVTPSGRVVLCDFGLAALEDADRVTRTGAELGSLPYMAPELLAGAVADPRTDVYGLGVTLYELLVRRNPFLHPSGSAATRQAVVDSRPAPLRRFERGLSRDLETVCAKAMDRDPHRRYPSAEAFAHDIRNLLGHRPVEARRPGPTLRVARWVQRHPGLAGSLAALLLIMFVAPVVFAAQEMRAAQRIKRQGDRSLRAIDAFLGDAAGIDLAGVPKVAALRERLLRESIVLYQEFEAEGRDTRHQRARSHIHLARIVSRQERYDDTEMQLVAARQLIDELALENPEDPQVLGDQAIVARDLASLHSMRGEVAALDQARRAQDLFEQVDVDSPDHDRQLENLVAFHIRQGLSAESFARYGEAREHYLDVLEHLEEIAATPGATPHFQYKNSAMGIKGLASLALREKDYEAALELSMEARELFLLALEVKPLAHTRAALGRTEGQIGIAFRGLGDAEAADEQAGLAVSMIEDLHAEFPDGGYDHALFAARLNIGVAEFERGERTRARETFRSLVEFALERNQASEDRRKWAFKLASSSVNLADTARLLGDTEEAREAAARADVLLTDRLDETPGDSTIESFLFAARTLLCELDIVAADVPATENSLDHLLASATDPPREQAQAARLLAKLVTAIGDDHAESGRLVERALGHLEHAISLGWADGKVLESGDFDPLRTDPRFVAAVQRVDESTR